MKKRVVTATEAAAGETLMGVSLAGGFRHEVSSEWRGLPPAERQFRRPRQVLREQCRERAPDGPRVKPGASMAFGETKWFRLTPAAKRLRFAGDVCRWVWREKHEKGIWWMPWH